MTYDLRLFRHEDAHALAALTRAAINVVGSHGYTADQVAAWAARHQTADRFIERVVGGSRVVVAADDSDTPVAYALLEPDGHLDMLYCHPEHTRCGLAELLLKDAEDHARKTGITRLYTEASELARPAFERAGYAVSHRRDFEIEHDGKAVPIHNYAMEKPLI